MEKMENDKIARRVYVGECAGNCYDRWLCGDPSDVPHVMHTRFPATAMV